MKKSETITDYILIRATTNSEWDSCDFAIIKLSDEWRDTMQQRIKAVEPFKNDSYFYHLSFWDAPEGFYKNIDEDDLVGEILKTESDWCFIAIDETELEKLPVPENKLEAQQILVMKNGYARFTAIGKHSGEDFYTSDFNINELIKK
jgi:hypothetical protein